MRYGFVSTYPPTLCGLATFTAALHAELVTASGGEGRVVRVVDEPTRSDHLTDVVGVLVADEQAGPARAASLLDDVDVAIVQHEYGVFGGVDGDDVLQLLASLEVPSIVVLHTVLSAPTPHQRSVLEDVATLADAVVVMTTTARDRLLAGYAVDMSKVSLIPHGAPATRAHQLPRAGSGRPTVLTWGLIGPGKGIEWGIDAIAGLRDLDPAPHYVVAGQTHPKVLAHQGERYRDGLHARIARHGLEGSVELDGRYRDASALAELVESADVVLLPYDSTDQVTSGVLIEAVAALKPVVATRFPHAVELLGDGAGLLVAQQDALGMTHALRTLLTHPELAAGMTRAASATAPELAWPTVAARYRVLAERLIRDRVAA